MSQERPRHDERREEALKRTPFESLRDIVRRRWPVLTLVPVLCLAVSALAAWLVPPRYASSISILVQKEETLNPLVLYEMAVSLASEDRLKSFNEIIYSRTTIQMLIDSLGIRSEQEGAGSRQQLIEQVRRDIATRFRSSDSFDITLVSDQPEKAKRGVELLADHFIRTRLRLENSRNEQTVLFFEQKTAEFEQMVSQRREEWIDASRSRLQTLPADDAALQERFEQVENGIRQSEWRQIDLQRERGKVEAFLAARERADLGDVFGLRLTGYPFDQELEESLLAYAEAEQLYTATHPTRRAARQAVLEFVERIPPLLAEQERAALEEWQGLQQERSALLEALDYSLVATSASEGSRSEYQIYSELLDEMKVKLEQARITRDLGRRAVDQFVVIDAPVLPEKPSSPNRMLLLFAGGALGVVLGVLGAGIAEFSDSTIRDEQDLRDFGRPVIAYLDQGTGKAP